MIQLTSLCFLWFFVLFCAVALREILRWCALRNNQSCFLLRYSILSSTNFSRNRPASLLFIMSLVIEVLAHKSRENLTHFFNWHQNYSAFLGLCSFLFFGTQNYPQNYPKNSRNSLSIFQLTRSLPSMPALFPWGKKLHNIQLPAPIIFIIITITSSM